MASAYYSRNNSYSRSFNAEVAESEFRFPLIRAAAHLGITSNAFKKGLQAADIISTEWHHVGKYANVVNYYDVSDCSEIVLSKKFWEGAKNKNNFAHCENYRIKCLRKVANIRLDAKLNPRKLYSFSYYDNKPTYRKSLEKRAKEFGLDINIFNVLGKVNLSLNNMIDIAQKYYMDNINLYCTKANIIQYYTGSFTLNKISIELINVPKKTANQIINNQKLTFNDPCVGNAYDLIRKNLSVYYPI